MMVIRKDKLSLVILLCLAPSTSWAYYTRQQCPDGVSHVMKACKCKEFTFVVYVLCDLAGETYERLPVFGQTNKTVARVTLQNGAIREVPRHVFGKVSVSHYFTNLCLISTSKWNDSWDSRVVAFGNAPGGSPRFSGGPHTRYVIRGRRDLF